MNLGIRDRVAVVLAASRGIGRGCAEALAAEGARLAVCGRDANILSKTAGVLAQKTEVFSQPCDVTDGISSRFFVDAVYKKFGRIDILVNNCGGPLPGGFHEALEEQVWREAFEKCLYQVVRWTQMIAPRMMEKKWGRIVNIVSTSVKEPIDGLMLSNALRPGVLGFTKSAARELAAHNVLINSILPGSIHTGRTDELIAERVKTQGMSPAEALAGKTAVIPMKRMGTIQEIGAACAFLCSEQASYITGTTLAVDGGLLRGI